VHGAADLFERRLQRQLGALRALDGRDLAADPVAPVVGVGDVEDTGPHPDQIAVDRRHDREQVADRQPAVGDEGHSVGAHIHHPHVELLLVERHARVQDADEREVVDARPRRRPVAVEPAHALDREVDRRDAGGVEEELGHRHVDVVPAALGRPDPQAQAQAEPHPAPLSEGVQHLVVVAGQLKRDRATVIREHLKRRR
jgi:hypothetical protein